ncbi:hypothetical protein ACH4FX_28745, partial [Streptomyces sp. NPDC018019]|uniref:hypothetical protein n=1 Tax=Streptomyces sp. NPDC018019 TaxID=3365030 RepID=UPI0037B89A04
MLMLSGLLSGLLLGLLSGFGRAASGVVSGVGWVLMVSEGVLWSAAGVLCEPEEPVSVPAYGLWSLPPWKPLSKGERWSGGGRGCARGTSRLPSGLGVALPEAEAEAAEGAWLEPAPVSALVLVSPGRGVWEEPPPAL